MIDRAGELPTLPVDSPAGASSPRLAATRPASGERPVPVQLLHLQKMLTPSLGPGTVFGPHFRTNVQLGGHHLQNRDRGFLVDGQHHAREYLVRLDALRRGKVGKVHNAEEICGS